MAASATVARSSNNGHRTMATSTPGKPGKPAKDKTIGAMTTAPSVKISDIIAMSVNRSEMTVSLK